MSRTDDTAEGPFNALGSFEDSPVIDDWKKWGQLSGHSIVRRASVAQSRLSGDLLPKLEGSCSLLR